MFTLTSLWRFSILYIVRLSRFSPPAVPPINLTTPLPGLTLHSAPSKEIAITHYVITCEIPTTNNHNKYRLRSSRVTNTTFTVTTALLITAYSRGGGVIIACATDLITELITSPANNEMVWVKISMQRVSLFIGGIYIPPGMIANNVLLNSLSDSIDSVQHRLKRNDSMLLLGDFNMPSIVWTPIENYSV